MVILQNRLANASRLLQAGLVLSACLFSQSVLAEEQETELHYSVYLGGLFLGGIETHVNQGESRYKIESTAITNKAFNWVINWIARGETEGLVGLDKFFPRQHQHKSTWNDNVRVVTLNYAKSGEVSVDKTGTRSEAVDKYTPIDPDSLTSSIDPMTAILTVTNRLDDGAGCNVTLPIFDGHRRYDAHLTETPPRYFKPSPYSVFEGRAIGCKIDIDRKGGFRVDQVTERDPKQDLIVWVGAPIEGGNIVPVRMQVDTQFGRMELHLDRYREGPLQLVSRNSQ